MWYDKKYDGDHTEKAIEICGPCRQERRASEAGSGREVRGEKRARKKKAGLHGGTGGGGGGVGVGYRIQCGGTFAAYG